MLNSGYFFYVLTLVKKALQNLKLCQIHLKSKDVPAARLKRNILFIKSNRVIRAIKATETIVKEKYKIRLTTVRQLAAVNSINWN